ASVISHEISHVTQRHLSRRIEAQKRSSPLTLAGLLGGILLAAINPEAGMAAIMTTQAGSIQSSINFTRSNEQEADRIGIKILAAAGFDPHGAPSFFDKLSAKYRFTSTPPSFLLTHPLPQSRVADSKLRAQRYPAVRLSPGLDFELVKSRVKARYELKPEQAVRYFQKQLKIKSYNLKVAAQYGLALAYSDSEQLKEAEQLINELLADDPKNLFYIDTYTDVLTRLKKYDKALAFLQQHYDLRPNNSVITINYASVAVSAKKPQIAVDLLNSFKISQGPNYIANDILTDAYSQLKNLSKYHELRAEKFALLSLYDRSIEELNSSLEKLDKSKNLESKRLKALQEQYRSQLDQIKRL
ncbi:MAG: putative Zn-dependent protease, partial [Alteromonadaceae bacterium]